jgi:hypothetical protein
MDGESEEFERQIREALGEMAILRGKFDARASLN